jgi:hypothetical protein
LAGAPGCGWWHMQNTESIIPQAMVFQSCPSLVLAQGCVSTYLN